MGEGMTARQHARRVAYLSTHTETKGECHVWTGFCGNNGYGYYRTADANLLAHRMAFELLVGPIPAGHELHHICETPACVNPAHLKPVTRSEHWRIGNSPSATRARQTHCKRGHIFSPENTYARPNGQRRCRKCHSIDEYARQEKEQLARKIVRLEEENAMLRAVAS